MIEDLHLPLRVGNSAAVSQVGKEGGYFQQNQQERDIPVPGGLEGREQGGREETAEHGGLYALIKSWDSFLQAVGSNTGECS